MSSKGYTTRQQIENYLLITIDPSFYTQIDEWIMEIESHIDEITGRNFVADTVASARYFDGVNSSKLLIDDCVEITEVKIGDSVMAKDTDPLLADGDYITYPLNAQALNRKVPITRIDLRGGYFPKWPAMCNRVTAKWGYSIQVPTDIRQAATVLVAGIINYSWNAEGEVSSMTVGRYTVSYKDEKQWQDFERIEKTLSSYRKFTF